MERHARISLIAYCRWMSRGCPEGSADEDWLAAETRAGALESEKLEAKPAVRASVVNEMARVDQTIDLGDLSAAK